MRAHALLLAMALAAARAARPPPPPPPTTPSFIVAGDRFLHNGAPVQLISGR